MDNSANKTAGQPLDILIIGAGIAGLTLAALLKKQEVQTTIIERQKEADYNKSGYMLGILPLGGRVMNALGLQQDYLNHSVSERNYKVLNAKGKCINSYSTEPIIDEFGDYQGISRPELVELLRKECDGTPLLFNTTVNSIVNENDSPEVTFSNGEKKTFDLVVAADGMHSATRKQFFPASQVEKYDTNWGGWVSWMDAHPEAQQEYREYWNAGNFLGLYPVKDKIGIFLGGPEKKIRKLGPQQLAERVSKRMEQKDQTVKDALAAFEKDGDFFFWNFHHFRSKVWRKGKLILLGDAAAGFLPTAGVGASMAMDSAAALADELSRSDREHLEFALKLYERRQRSRVEKAQKNSRQLAKLMFVNNAFLAKIRNLLLPFYTMDHFLKDIRQVMEGT